jgi:hypothetical protein
MNQGEQIMQTSSADSADIDSPKFHAELARSCDAAAKAWIEKRQQTERNARFADDMVRYGGPVIDSGCRTSVVRNGRPGQCSRPRGFGPHKHYCRQHAKAFTSSSVSNLNRE